MPWYVVRTKPQHEIKTAAILEKAGVNVYCPVITEVRQWSDRRKKVTVPLFKSYVFVNLEEKARNKVFEAPGVNSFLYYLNKPAIVREEEIEVLRSWLENDKANDFQVGMLKPGDEVVLKSGKMKDKKAVIQQAGNKKLKLILKEVGWTLTVNVQDLL